MSRQERDAYEARNCHPELDTTPLTPEEEARQIAAGEVWTARSRKCSPPFILSVN
jgi:hypothetical protein